MTKAVIGWRTVGLAAMAATVSACASSRPAPIVYSGEPLRAPAPAVTAPAPASSADLSRIPFDETTLPLVLAGLPHSECVPYARTASGVEIWGDAVTWWAQADGRYVRSSSPAEGSVLVLDGYNDESRGHVSVVKAIVNDRMIRVDHANWMAQGEVSINVPVIDVSAANDWSEVRVWHIPGGHWGGRVYRARGFIHPFKLDGGAGLSG